MAKTNHGLSSSSRAAVRGRGDWTVATLLRDRLRTIRLLTSIVAFPLFWALETSLIGWVAGLRWALAFFLSLALGA